jgi:isocitrate dehydrogenase
VAHRVTLIYGDGTGPELTEATRRVLEATGVDLEWDVQEAGSDVMDRYGGNPLPDHVLDSIKRNGVALKGPITTPVGGGFRSVNVALRKGLDLYAQVRPCKSYPGVRSRYEDVDLVIVIGSRNSSNSRRLVEVARSGGVAAHLIDDESEIEEAWLEGVETVGITCGASAPESLVRRVVGWFRARGVRDVESQKAAPENVAFKLPLEVRA